MTMLLLVLPTGRVMGQLSPGPLARAHRSLEGATQCISCHPIGRAPQATACLTCHKDIKTLVDQRRGLHGRLSTSQKAACASCHPDHGGVDFDMVAWPEPGRAKFDHRQAGWALDGKHQTAKCESCHTGKYRTDPVAALSKRTTGTPWVGLTTTCTSCHAADDIHKGELKGGCQQCHTAKAWAPAPKFDHDSARFPLTGKHGTVKCAECHATARLPLRTAADGKRIPLYRPVPFAKCSDCHADPHKGRIRESCASCHETTGWAKVDTKGFDHGATRYPLKGRHARVSCAGCHGAKNEKPTPAFATCASCHRDVHRGEGRTARDCASCHGVDGFAPATFTVAQHAVTGYPLAGKHRVTSCAACHTTSGTGAARYVRLAMASATCADCHADAHGGQAAAASANGSCTACHTIEGFAPSTISAAAHASFRFPLDGAHRAAACTACHGASRPGLPAPTVAAGRAKFVFAMTDTACASCHVDPHRGRYLAGGARATLGCRGCHDASAFRPSSITSASHATLGYALDGAHRAVPCVECHRELSAPTGTGTLRLSAAGVPALPFAQVTARSCAGCHRDVHASQFAARKDGGACEGCHVTERFAGASRFDHERQTRFPLAGAHAKVACARCHAVMPTAGGALPPSARLRYAGVSMACESCHKPTAPRVR